MTRENANKRIIRKKIVLKDICEAYEDESDFILFIEPEMSLYYDLMDTLAPEGKNAKPNMRAFFKLIPELIEDHSYIEPDGTKMKASDVIKLIERDGELSVPFMNEIKDFLLVVQEKMKKKS